MDLNGKGSRSVEGEPQLWVSNPRPPGMACTSTRKASLKFMCHGIPHALGDQPLEMPNLLSCQRFHLERVHQLWCFCPLDSLCPEVAQPLITHLLGEKRGCFYAKNTDGEEETACMGMGCPDRSAEHYDI